MLDIHIECMSNIISMKYFFGIRHKNKNMYWIKNININKYYQIESNIKI